MYDCHQPISGVKALNRRGHHTDFDRVNDSACLQLMNRKIVLGIF